MPPAKARGRPPGSKNASTPSELTVTKKSTIKKTPSAQTTRNKNTKTPKTQKDQEEKKSKLKKKQTNETEDLNARINHKSAKKKDDKLKSDKK